jgi:osmoprotectant transport system permease protein
MRRIAVSLAAVLLMPNGVWAESPVVRIGSKSFTEGVILGELITQLAKDAGADARHDRELGGTQIVFKALVAGEIDAYPEYTGTLAAEILQDEPAETDEQIRAALARRGIRMSERLGFSNTYALGMKEDLAKRLQLTKISQLAEPHFAKLKPGFSDEFMNRGDGWPGLKRHYELPFRPRGMDHNLAYRGLAADSIEMTDLYSTDAEVQYYNLRLLEDDRGYFPHYYCVILYRDDLAARAAQVVASIKRLESRVQPADMVAMNKRAKIDRISEARVAAEFVGERFGVQVDLPEERPMQDLLENLLLTTGQHLFLVGISLAAAVVVAVPLGIWAYKWPPLAHGILGVVGIIQTIPSMAVLVFMIPLLGLGAWPAIVALFLYSLLPIVRGTLTGLRDIPNHLKESATVLGLSPSARLWLVELPIASRSILSGIKTAAVINVGTATIGALIGAGGYGQPILTGIRLDRIDLILQGAIPAAVLALVVQGLFDLAEPLLVPRGLRLATGKS